jgi:hypothetical protein
MYTSFCAKVVQVDLPLLGDQMNHRYSVVNEGQHVRNINHWHT